MLKGQTKYYFIFIGFLKAGSFGKGFNGFFMLNAPMQAQLPPEFPQLLQAQTTRLVGHGFVQEGLIRTRVDTINIGPLVLADAIVDTRASHPSNVLGSEILKQYNVLFDLTGGAAYFVRRTPFTPRPQAPRSFGFSFDSADDHVRIGALYRNSAAEQAGLQSGDIVLRMNGTALAFTDYCHFIQDFELADQERIELVLLRDGREWAVDLEKKPLF